MIGLRCNPIVGWLRVARSALLVEAGLRTQPLDELARALGIELTNDDRARDAAGRTGDVSAQVRWTFEATDRVLGFLPGRATCLRRALIAGHLLRKHRPAIRIGSARQNGKLAFHAWLEFDGKVASDPEAASFRRLVRARSMS
jgi:hypothetical protein